MNDSLETDIASLLAELADVQSAILAVLAEKRTVLASPDHRQLAQIATREEALIGRLQACHVRREQMLASAEADGLPGDSIQSLSSRLSEPGRARVQASIRDAANRSRLLQHQSLTNWVLVQRTLLHLSQLIEIIATGGRSKPTYGKGSDRQSGGLVDQAA